MKNIIYQLSSKFKITIADEEIRIKHPVDYNQKEILQLENIARKLDLEFKDITFTKRSDINFDKETFKVKHAGNKNGTTKNLSDYIKS